MLQTKRPLFFEINGNKPSENLKSVPRPLSSSPRFGPGAHGSRTQALAQNNVERSAEVGIDESYGQGIGAFAPIHSSSHNPALGVAKMTSTCIAPLVTGFSDSDASASFHRAVHHECNRGYFVLTAIANDSTSLTHVARHANPVYTVASSPYVLPRRCYPYTHELQVVHMDHCGGDGGQARDTLLSVRADGLPLGVGQSPGPLAPPLQRPRPSRTTQLSSTSVSAAPPRPPARRGAAPVSTSAATEMYIHLRLVKIVGIPTSSFGPASFTSTLATERLHPANAPPPCFPATRARKALLPPTLQSAWRDQSSPAAPRVRAKCGVDDDLTPRSSYRARRAFFSGGDDHLPHPPFPPFSPPTAAADARGERVRDREGKGECETHPIRLENNGASKLDHCTTTTSSAS
ncbi:hypothetical protein C8R45DRAFT_1159942 [Mycena sanguinolenta]|nr:hypothetical protein C8R45DRAFT_1159942 [Mycena sanguinolenta]